MQEAKNAQHEVTLCAVTGVSIGAVNAACVVGSNGFPDACARLKAIWEDLRLDTLPLTPPIFARDAAFFGLPGFYVPRADFWNAPRWTHIYEIRFLIDTLNRHVSFDALNASATALVVTAVNVTSGELIRFRNEGGNHPQPKEPHPGIPVTDKRVRIGPDHILASGSLAPQFPWTKIGGDRYWDGGLVDNTPLGDAIDAFSEDPEAVQMLVVMNLYPLHGNLPENMGQVLDRVHELSFGNRLRQDREGAQRINDMLNTLDELAALAEAGNKPITGTLKSRLERFRRYKVVDLVDIDFQDRGGAPQDTVDDANGLRDFSAETVEQRGRIGYHLAQSRLDRAFRNIETLESIKACRSNIMSG
jgi:NTE family protein